MRVHLLLDEPTKWCQGAMARNGTEERCNVNATKAVQWDVLGGIYRCYNQRDQQHEIKYRLAYHLRRNELIPLNTVIGNLASATVAIREWNDSHSTTYHEIIEALQSLDI